MVLVTSHGFRGAYLGSQPRPVDDRDRRRRHRHGARLRLFERAARRRSGEPGEDRPHRRRARGRAAQSAQGVDPQGAGGVRSARGGLAGLASRQRRQRRLGRAQDQLPARQDGREAVRRRHPHHRRSAAQARPALASVRRRRRRRQEARAGRRRRVALLAARLRDRARTRARHHRPRPARRVLGAVAGRRATCIWKPGTLSPDAADRRHRGRLLRHRPDRHGRQHGHRRLQPRRLRLLDRERQAHLCGERGHHRRPSVRYLPHAHAGQRSRIPLRHQCADACGWRA